MDLTQMYMASPDWLKLVFILAPCVTVYCVARIWGRVRHENLTLKRVERAEWVALPKE